jgi:hypothetical protein
MFLQLIQPNQILQIQVKYFLGLIDSILINYQQLFIDGLFHQIVSLFLFFL